MSNAYFFSGEVHPYVKAVNEIAELWFYRNRYMYIVKTVQGFWM